MYRVRGKVVSLDIGELSGNKYGQITINTPDGNLALRYDFKSDGRIPPHGADVEVTYENPNFPRIVSIRTEGADLRPHTRARQNTPPMQGIDIPALLQKPSRPVELGYDPPIFPEGQMQSNSPYIVLSNFRWPNACVGCADTTDPNMALFKYDWSQKHVTEGAGTTCLRSCCFGLACAAATRKKEVTHQLDIPISLCSSCKEEAKQARMARLLASGAIFMVSLIFFLAMATRRILLYELFSPTVSLWILLLDALGLWLSSTLLYAFGGDISQPFSRYIGIRAATAISSAIITFRSSEYADVFQHLNPNQPTKTNKRFSGDRSYGCAAGFGCLILIALTLLLDLFLLV